jgi:sulfhydrogenase subunit beta (sulfur reductase)
MTEIIKKENLAKFLALLSDYDIFAPGEVDGVVLYGPLEGDIVLDFSNSRKPPKGAFFPQTEKMFDFRVDGPRITGVEEPEKSDAPILLLGVRPCDSRAMLAIDKLFSWDYIDPYYVSRRQNATTISFSCQTPDRNCFCTSMGGSPVSPEGADMLWTDIGNRYLVESMTEKGEAVLGKGQELFSKASEADIEAGEAAKKKAEGGITRTLDTEGVEEALEKVFESQHWKDFSARCLGCGICTLLCPTCHCFDIYDIVTGGKAWRERTWDSCQYPYYSLHASGHNPRPDKSFRQRNRVYHKFYYMRRNLDVLGCVGCGRCISNCPVDIDIIEAVEDAKEAGK